MLTVAAPPSKSVSHRMLMGAALAQGVSEVRHVLMSKDIERTMAILTAAGARFEPLEPETHDANGGAGAFRVHGMGNGPKGAPLDDQAVPPLSCDVHESGTTCRLLTAILAAGRGRFRLHGAPRMHQRPVGELTDVLQKLGVTVTFEGHSPCPPLVLSTKGFNAPEADTTTGTKDAGTKDGVKGGAHVGTDVTIGLDESSQYLSGLLLAAPLATQGLCITLGGNKVVSWPYVGLTLQALEDFGLQPRVETRLSFDAPWQQADWRQLREARPQLVRFHINHGTYKAGQYRVEGDWSGASYFLAAGAVGRAPLCVTGLRADSLQGDRALVGILQNMGARVDVAAHGITVHPSPLRGATLDMGQCPDLVPTVAAMAAFATGCTTVVNVAHLRIKESDRIAAPAAELRKVGVSVDEHDDGLTVHGLGKAPEVPAGTVFHVHGDHRIAMSTALLTLYEGSGTGHNTETLWDDPTVVRKSFPHFWNLWNTVRSCA